MRVGSWSGSRAAGYPPARRAASSRRARSVGEEASSFVMAVMEAKPPGGSGATLQRAGEGGNVARATAAPSPRIQVLRSEGVLA